MHGLCVSFSILMYAFVLYLSYTQGNLLYTLCISILSILVYSLVILDHKLVQQNIYYKFIPEEEEDDDIE